MSGPMPPPPTLAQMGGRDHAAPICYERVHIQLAGPEQCWAVVLGCFLWGRDWPHLRAKIDAALGYAGSPDTEPRLTAELSLGGAVIGLQEQPDGSIRIVP